VATGRLIGREAEVGTVFGLVEAGARLVTLWGPGGVGKTRLAAEVAGRLCADGGFAAWWFCDLSAARNADGICAQVSDVLGLRVAAATAAETIDPIGRALAARGRALVVLDNFEQVAFAAPAVLGPWIVSAPEVCFLVTSREALGLGDEILCEIAPLAPAAAVELFDERARSIQRAVAPSAVDPRIVEEIVERLDRLPLAIELGAAQLALLGLPDLFARLAQSMDVLDGARRDLPDRQHTLRRTIDWSWRLLSAAEQAGLAQLSVFAGGFFPEAAERVLVVTGAGAPTPLALLQSLRRRSLIQVWDPEVGGELRCRLLVAVREHAGERLADSGAAGAARARHSAYYAEAGADWAAAVRGQGGPRALRLLSLEQDNLIAAHRTAVVENPPAAGRALAAALALEPLIAARGPLDVLRRLVDDALGAGVAVPDALAARALRARGRSRLAGAAAALTDFDRAEALARRAGDVALAASVLTERGRCIAEQGHGKHAAAVLEQAVALARSVGDHSGEAEALTNLAMNAWYDGRLADAAGCYAEAADAARAVGDRVLEARIRGNLGCLAYERGDVDEFIAVTEEARALVVAAGDQRHAAILATNLGAGVGEQGRFADAETSFAEALTALRAIGDVVGEATCEANLGWTAQRRAGPAAGRAHFERALALLRGRGVDWAEGLVRASLAAALAAADRLDEAARHEALAEPIMARVSDGRLRDAATVLAGHIDLARARAAAAAGDRAAAVRHHAAAQTRLADDAGPEGARSMVRFARSLLQRALAEGDATAVPERPAGAAPPASPTADATAALLVCVDAAWFRPAGAAWVDLRRRRALRRVLLALIERRLTAPGAALTTAELLAAGWPGERVLAAAGAARVHVAVSTLRRLGLAGLLRHDDAGYALDPAADVVTNLRAELVFSAPAPLL
jgi:predicted ATPase